MDHDSKLLQYVLDTLNGDGGWRVGSLNQLVRVDHLGGDSLELGLLDLDDHPATYLLGFTAPPSWRVLGVVCTGFAGPMAAPGEEQVRPSAHPDAIRVRVVSLMARSGAQIGRLHRSDGTTSDTGEGQGLVPDLLSRALGLPTPPPPVPPKHLVALRWLEAVLGGVADDLPEPLPRDAGWDFFRRRLVDGDPMWNYDYHLWPEDAEWMDDGMLARWLLGEHPPLPKLLDELDRGIGPQAAHWARAEVARFLHRA